MIIEKTIILNASDYDALRQTSRILDEINHYGCFSAKDIKDIAIGKKYENVKINFEEDEI